MQLILLYFK